MSEGVDALGISKGYQRVSDGLAHYSIHPLTHPPING